MAPLASRQSTHVHHPSLTADSPQHSCRVQWASLQLQGTLRASRACARTVSTAAKLRLWALLLPACARADALQDGPACPQARRFRTPDEQRTAPFVLLSSFPVRTTRHAPAMDRSACAAELTDEWPTKCCACGCLWCAFGRGPATHGCEPCLRTRQVCTSACPGFRAVDSPPPLRAVAVRRYCAFTSRAVHTRVEARAPGCRPGHQSWGFAAFAVQQLSICRRDGVAPPTLPCTDVHGFRSAHRLRVLRHQPH